MDYNHPRPPGSPERRAPAGYEVRLTEKRALHAASVRIALSHNGVNIRVHSILHMPGLSYWGAISGMSMLDRSLPNDQSVESDPIDFR